MMDTNWVEHIDWTKEQTYEDLADLFGALSKAFLGADVTSGAGDFTDGSTKQYVLARMIEMSHLMRKHDKWVRVREEKNYSPHEGHRKN